MRLPFLSSTRKFNVKNKKKALYFLLLLILVVFALLFSGSFNFSQIIGKEAYNNSESKKKNDITLTNEDLSKSKTRKEYGIDVSLFKVDKKKIKKNDLFGKIMYSYGVTDRQILDIISKSKYIFNFERNLIPGNSYTAIYEERDSNIQYFIYEIDLTNYVVIDFREAISVYKKEKQITTKLKVTTGEISSSLSEAVSKLNVSDRIAIELSEIYAWSIDFFRIQKGDGFKVYYENKYIDSSGFEKYIGIGKILAAEFTHKDKAFYAFYYEDTKDMGEYFDKNGNTLRKAFLKAPLNYYRISSRYSKNRKHPVTGQWKGHFGTDYAAPTGTPIMTTASGTIDFAGYSKYNGNYVKVRHNSTYSTQYLHMSKIKSGISKGVYVKQGDIIGYVGMTGLATGPHVCYRFWKNGVQVDPYKQDLPPGLPVKEENKKEFLKLKDSLINKLNM